MLLSTVAAAAAAAAAAAGVGDRASPYPIILNANPILKPSLQPSPSTPSPVAPLGNGALSDSDAALSSLASTLAASLSGKKKHKLKPFLRLVSDFLRSAAAALSLRLPASASESSVEFVAAAVSSIGFVLGCDLPAIIVEKCADFDDCDAIIEAVIGNKLLKGCRGSAHVVGKLVERKKVWLLCLYVKNSNDLRSEEAFAVMRFFLSPDEEGFGLMKEVKKRWSDSALLAIEKAVQKKLPKDIPPLAKDAAVLLMMAHDDFTPAEVCLHYLLGSGSVDGLVLSSAIASLDGTEVVGLFGYLVKWMRKYERFPEAMPCPKANSALGIVECESVPPFESVVATMGLLLDEHFSYLVWNKEIHEELRDAEEVVTSLASEVDLCFPVLCVINQLLAEASRI